MSSMDANESNGKSKKIISNVIKEPIDITNKLGIADKHPSENKISQIVNKLSIKEGCSCK